MPHICHVSNANSHLTTTFLLPLPSSLLKLLSEVDNDDINESDNIDDDDDDYSLLTYDNLYVCLTYK